LYPWKGKEHTSLSMSEDLDKKRKRKRKRKYIISLVEAILSFYCPDKELPQGKEREEREDTKERRQKE